MESDSDVIERYALSPEGHHSKFLKSCYSRRSYDIKHFNRRLLGDQKGVMNVARTVVTIVSSSKRTQAEVEPISRFPAAALRPFSGSIKTTQIFTLADIPKESRAGDEEFYMLMLDG